METAQEPQVDVIIPPEAIRNIIEKTAQFVATRGLDFERRMLLEPNAKDRFDFLYANNPFRNYYDAKVREYTTGEVIPHQTIVPEAIIELRKREEERKSKKDKLLMLEGIKPSTHTSCPEQKLIAGDVPAEDVFSLRHPYIAPIDSDIIKLTAQFVASNGSQFLTGLQYREKTNPQFEFMKAAHPAHHYFKSLIDSYQKCLRNNDEVRDHVKSVIEVQSEDIRGILKRMRIRQLWSAEEDKCRKVKDEAEAEERAAMSAIDWDKFVVVETIVFTENDHRLILPSPLTLESVRGVRLAQVDQVKPMAPPPAPMFIDTAEKEDTRPPEPSSREDSRMIIKSGYLRRMKRGASHLLQKCPLTGELIPVKDMTQHLKILLLDPQWKEQRAHLLNRAKADSAFAPESDVESNIAQFVLRRPDLFGTVEDEIQEHVAADSKTMLAEEEKSTSKRSRF